MTRASLHVSVTWRCPRCGRTTTTHTPHAQAGTCAHRGTPHDGHKPDAMQPTGATT